MEDSATEAEIRHNGIKAEVRDAKAEAELAERERLLEYAEQNVSNCVFDFLWGIEDDEDMKELFCKVFSSMAPQNETIGKAAGEVVEEYKINWAKTHRDM